MNNVSFQGNIVVTSWDKTISSFKNFPTSKAQDKVLKSVINDLGEEKTLISLSKKNTNLIQGFIEKFTGKPLKKINNEKVFYHDGDIAVFSDKNPALFDGERVEFNFGD